METTYDIDATYSAEDNKLRLYSFHRLDDDLYQRVKEAGFKWAPKQELFVAPIWTPAREDLCLELAGSITAEQSTMIDRAEAKAERLDDLAERRGQDANSFRDAADAIAARFAGGQPILVGHHSERKARKDQEKVNNYMGKSVAASDAVDYWRWKAEGVERHANRKSNPGVRARRIKTLLADLRSCQRTANHAHLCLKIWEGINAKTDPVEQAKLTSLYVGGGIKTGSTGTTDLYWAYDKGEKTTRQVIDEMLALKTEAASWSHNLRWISHLLNRLAYERNELGPVAAFDGELTAVIIQGFAREQGAHKPKAVFSDDTWTLSSTAPLPAHISNEKTITLTAGQWVSMFVASGYEVPAPKPKNAPILNFKTGFVSVNIWGKTEVFRQIEITKKEYSAIYNDHRGVKLSSCGQFRVKVCKNPEPDASRWEWVTVYISDSKTHPVPVSDAISDQKPEAA